MNEDCTLEPDMLAGSMDLRVVLPCGSVARCHVDRSTPMMDLLVQLARAHKMSPTAHTLQPFGNSNNPLQFQPSTPVGALDVFTVKIVPKTRSIGPLIKRAAPRPAQQPFEQTFRLQVHLPRNQLFVMRASRATILGEIRQQVCSEKNLDPNKYELRHPANLELRLSPESSVGECGLTEVALVSTSSSRASRTRSAQPDILHRHQQYGFLVSHSTAADGSVSSMSSGSLGGRSTSPAPSDGDRSTSPLQVQSAVPPPHPGPAAPPGMGPPPSRPGRKRRPAPKPPAPAPVASELNNNMSKDVDSSGGTIISHSRNSSDSSGYHEASVLSESPEGNSDSLPGVTRRNKLHSCTSMSRSMTNLNMPPLSVRGDRHSIAVSGLSGPPIHSASTSSLSSAGQRKRKAPPPPLPSQTPTTNGTDVYLKTQSLERHVPIPETLESPVKSSTLPACSSPPEAFPVGSSSCSPTPTPSEQSAHLSETSTPVVVPRPVPRSMHTTPLATVPVPRPRPRKQLAPTPPLSPVEVEREKLDSFVSVASSFVDEDALSEGSSAVFEDLMDSEETFSSQYSGEQLKNMDVEVEHEMKRNMDVEVELPNAEIGTQAAQSPGVHLQSLPHVLNKTGEEVDSDFGTEEISSQEKLEPLSSFESEEQGSIISKEKEYTKLSPHDDTTLIQKSNQPIVQNYVEEEWEYHLPSPPSAFQDSRCHSPAGTNAENNTGKCDSDPIAPSNSEQIIKPSPKEILSSNLEHPSSEQSVKQVHSETLPAIANSKDVALLSNLGQKESKVAISDGETSKQTSKVTQNEIREETPRKDILEQAAECVESQNPDVSKNKTVISTAKSVIRSTSVPSEVEKKRLDGPAAVLSELNQVLSEQRSRNSSSSSRSALQQSESVPSSAPIENFSLSVYSQPVTPTEAHPLEVRPSLVLARRSSFSNSNANSNVAPRVNGTGVRRTTSHATLVGSRRDSYDVFQSHTKSIENVSNHGDSSSHKRMNNTEERKPLGRTVSEMNLNAGFSVAPQLEPELLQEFMEWRKQRQREQQDKEESEKAKPQEMVTSVELQSPQVLRTILPQLNPVQGGTSKQHEAEKEEMREPEKPQEVPTKAVETVVNAKTEEESIKRQVPRGPPSIQLSTWNERPKRQVSLKLDRDYWTGMGGATPRTGLDKTDGPEPSIPENTSEDASESHSQVPLRKEDKFPSKPLESVQRLTRQFIAHTTPSGFRRAESVPAFNNSVQHSVGKLNHSQSGISLVAEKSRTPDTIQIKPIVTEKPEVLQKPYSIISSGPHRTAVEIPVTSRNDPSRVPIVRAVELKKPFAQHQKASNNSVVYFSGPSSASNVPGKHVLRPQSSNPALPVKKFTSVVDISGPSANEKTVNGNGISQSNSNEPNVHVNGFSSNPEPKKALPMPIVKGFKVAQGAVGRQLSAPAATPAPPTAPPAPPAPSMPVLRKVVRPTSLPPMTQDPRAQLLDAIRSFGGRTKLRPTT